MLRDKVTKKIEEIKTDYTPSSLETGKIMKISAGVAYCGTQG